MEPFALGLLRSAYICLTGALHIAQPSNEPLSQSATLAGDPHHCLLSQVAVDNLGGTTFSLRRPGPEHDVQNWWRCPMGHQ